MNAGSGNPRGPLAEGTPRRVRHCESVPIRILL